MKKDLTTVFAVLGVVFGMATIVMGIIALGSGEYAEYASFGGDFYTYSYKATRYAANNLIDLIKAVGYFIISFGLFDIAYFGCKLAGCFSREDIVSSSLEEKETLVDEGSLERK